MILNFKLTTRKLLKQLNLQDQHNSIATFQKKNVKFLLSHNSQIMLKKVKMKTMFE